MDRDTQAAEFLVDAQWLGQHRGDPALILIDTRAPADRKSVV